MKLEQVEHTHVGGIKTACVTRAQMVQLIHQRSQDYKDKEQGLGPMVVFDSNGQGISIANSDPMFANMLAQADIVHADGQSVVSFSRMLGGRAIPERSATTDMIHDIPRQTNAPMKHYLLGGKPVVVETCAKILSRTYNNMDIVGTHHGYFPSADESILIDKINAAKPDVLWVGLGKPKEQAFCLRHKDKLDVPVIITCGGCFNYITGDYQRAPMTMQRMGLEWLHRAVTEPRKFLWRYLTTNPHAIYCVLRRRSVAL